ncbi:MAG: FAD-binding protein [Arenicellales bacterium]
MYRIAVCIKQVPLSDDPEFDCGKGTIRREGRNVISAFDLRAIAMAVHIGRQYPDTRTIVITMGPPQAADALREALAMGMDEAVHLVDPVLAGADSLATARALAGWLGQVRPDLILVGKYSLDAETAQVGPQLAELLGMAQVTGARALRIEGRVLHAERESDEGFEEVYCALPAVVTCAERLIKPVKLGPGERDVGRDKPLRSVSAAEIGVDETRLGYAGSPTRVGNVRRVAHVRTPGTLIRDAEPEDAVREALKALQRLGWKWGGRGVSEKTRSYTPRQPLPGRDVWVACEINASGQVSRSSLELLTRGATLADVAGGELVTLLPAPGVGEPQIRTLSDHGADRIALLELTPDLAYSPDTMAAAVAPLIEQVTPALLLSPATERGRDWMPRLAARLGLGMTGDAVDLAIGADGAPIAHKPAFGGSLIAEIHSWTRPHMASVRPGMLGRPVRVMRESLAEVIRYPVNVSEPMLMCTASHTLIDSRVTPLGEARIVVGVGRGIGGLDGIAVASNLARALGAALCGTRPVCDEGWLPRQLQVGLTGKSLNVDLYIALGVSGSPNHAVALKGAQRILAVNDDPDAPIFKWADVGVLGACVDVARAMTMLSKELTEIKVLPS